MMPTGCPDPIDIPIRWENPATRRYYVASVQQDLFGEWELYCCWGGIGTRRGNSRSVPADSYGDAQAKLARLSIRRLKRHYTQVRP
jgi:predicted DNA-binding WGR domain protein